MSDDGFLSRWSRRKVDVARGVVAPDGPAFVPPAAPIVVQPSPTTEVAEPAPPEAPPALTLDDVAALTPESSYARFVTRDVSPEVKNAAMKKLFTDPHYNVMDGLDTYIEDYGIADPIPDAMLRLMNQSKSLGLFDHEEESADATDGAAPPIVTSLPAEVPMDFHEDADLRLQQDDAAERPGAATGVDDGAGR